MTDLLIYMEAEIQRIRAKMRILEAEEAVLQRVIDAAGPEEDEIAGITSDGTKILKPATRSKKFTGEDLREAAIGHNAGRLYDMTPPTPKWIEWSGGDCPVGRDDRVEVLMLGGAQVEVKAQDIYWRWIGADGDIVRYRVTRPAPQFGQDAIKKAREQQAHALDDEQVQPNPQFSDR